MTKIAAFICDIDGTVADHTDLRGHYEYDKVYLDKPIWPVIRIVQTMNAVYQPIFVSGRMDEKNVRQLTEDWIENNIGFYPGTYPLFMRAEGDYRPDDDVKYDIYNWVIKDRYEVHFVLDDRNRVVDMWRRIGLQCLQVAPGDF